MDLLPRVFLTEGDITDFEPNKIFDSILKETGINEEDAKNITELVVRRIISSGMKFLSGPHIREIVCSILSEQHFEEERKLYTRIGMPLMDYEEILERGPPAKLGEIINPEKIHHWAADQLAEEYTLLRILSNEESKSHLSGDLHIHKLKYFDLRPLSQSWDPRMILKSGLPPVIEWTSSGKLGPAEDLRNAAQHLAKWLGMTQGEFSGSQGYNFISMYLAPYAKGLNEEEIKQGIQALIHEINQLSAVIARNTPNTSISSSPAILDVFSEIPAVGPGGKIIGKYGDYNDECIKLFDSITEIFSLGDYRGNSFNYPKHTIYIKNRWLDNFSDTYSKIWRLINSGKNVYLVNLSSKWVMNEINEQYPRNGLQNFGTLQNISLNLPRYSYLSKNEDNFMEIIREKMNMCSIIFKKKYEIIEKRLKSKHLPLCSSFIKDHELPFKLENQNLAFNFIGLNEAVKYLTDYELHEKLEAFNFGKKILTEMKTMCDELSQKNGRKYILQENVSTKVMYRFAKLDSKHFQSNYKERFYTNSAHFKKDIDLELSKQIELQGEFHKILQNGRNFFKISSKKIGNFQNLIDLVKFACLQDIACLQFIS